MAFTTEELAEVRTWVVWDPPTDAELNERHDALGGMYAVVVWYLRLKYSQLLAEPASYAISGEYSQSTGANIEAFAARLAEAEGLAAAEASGSAAGVGYLERTGGPWAR